MLVPSSNAYAELHCMSSFSFLRGASHPEELVERAQELGYAALAITDECSVAGVVRAHMANKNQKLKLIIGSEFNLSDGLHLVLLAPNRQAYGQLCALISQARRAAAKGEYVLSLADMQAAELTHCLALYLVDEKYTQANLQCLKKIFPDRLWLAVALNAQAGDDKKLKQLQSVANKQQLPIVACGNVHMHVRGRRALQDVLTAIRLNIPINKVGYALHANGERHLRPVSVLQQIYPHALIAETMRIANLCEFDLSCLRYEYPRELVPQDLSPSAYLRQLTEQGMQQRWPTAIPKKVITLVEHELKLIAEMHYEYFFLTVHDIVRFAKSQKILCQGRGSAANSAVCYCLGITEVDPSRMETLFERFISKERNEPPDIDVDFEHERREEVIQYIYQKYGRHRAALAATVITYRPRSAIRDVGKALSLDTDQIERLAKSNQWWDGAELQQQRLRDAGFDANNKTLQRVLKIANLILGFPRHLSQHVGGFVISQGPLSQLVPVENAAMADRTVIQWDKDDLESLGLLKVDVLALGMLSAIRRALFLINNYYGKRYCMADIPAEDPQVYEMISRADTIGVFQVESRAQMAMLPRLKPRCFYDLVIEISLVRPGPIQGKMVHPYLRRRQGLEAVSYPSERV
ncbi:MAG: PHP domain-containing protein, partial [Gammaproteobacteria bacterium]|nr:PHP domain-containing protein [Gammaproteobacteria bacterium]